MDLTLLASLAGMFIGYGVGLVIGWLAGKNSSITLKDQVIMMFICLTIALVGIFLIPIN